MKTIIIDGVEYNLTPKVSFHECDWVVFNNKYQSIYQVEKIEDVYYILRHTHGGAFRVSVLHDESLRLWTIQDAKDGDVLAAHECLVLFREIDGLNIRCYCTYHFMNNPSFYVDTLQNKDAFHPATKEQRDQLEKAMADAGYAFDFEKNELKEIEHEEYDCEDYGIDSLWHAKNILEKTLGEVEGYQTDDGILDHKCAISFIDKLYKQKPAEWSEEDESNFQGIIDDLKANKHHAPDSDLPTYDRFLSWFKSLKERYVWKPSDEQMEALEHFVRCIGESGFASPYDNNTKLLYSLLDSLKKLTT